MNETILLAMNGSESATVAAQRAIDVASERDATLHVLCVVDRRVLDEPGLSSLELVTVQAEDYGHESITEVAQRAAEVGVDVEGDVRHGVPADLILEYADDIDAEVIIVGEHGDHDLHLGGVGREVDERSDRDVLVVTAPES